MMSSKTYLVLFTLTKFFKSFYSHTKDIYRGVHPGQTLCKVKFLKRWYISNTILLKLIFQGVPSAVHLNIIIISSSLDRAFQIKNLKLRFVRCACLDGCCVMTNDRRLVNTWPGLLKVSLVTCFIELLATRVWDVHYPHQHRPLNQPDPHRRQCPGEKQVHSTCAVKHRYMSTRSLLLRVQWQICDTT